MQTDWDKSAGAWIRSIKSESDYARFAVLDDPMSETVRQSGAKTALDVGCGDGRFCRMMAEHVPEVTGLDPTEALLEEARAFGHARYVKGVAEQLPFADQSFDLVVSDLSLIDIPDIKAAYGEFTRVLRSGGTLLIANLNSWITAAQTDGLGIVANAEGHGTMTIVNYLSEYAIKAEWAGVSVKNWHRPLATYMQLALENGLRLKDFKEPSGDPAWAKTRRYNHTPYLLLQVWEKP